MELLRSSLTRRIRSAREWLRSAENRETLFAFIGAVLGMLCGLIITVMASLHRRGG